MVEVKSTEKISVAYSEGKGINNFEKEESKLKSELENNDIKPQGSTIGIFYDNPQEVGFENVRFELCIPINETSRYHKTKTLESIRAASITHKGDFSTLEQSFNEIFSWISRNDHEITGPVREIYLDKYITEIQIPIKYHKHSN